MVEFSVFSRNQLRLLVVALACLLASRALAQTAQTHGYGVRVEGACPTTAQVTAALDFVLGAGSAIDGTAANRVSLEVADLGDRYRVSLATLPPTGGEAPMPIQSREYTDAARGCEERARVAAVYAVVTGEPPDVVVEQLPRALAPPPRPPLRVALAAGPMLVVAARAGASVPTWGGELRAVITGPRFGATLGVGLTTPAPARWGRDEAQVSRIPFDAGARAAARYRRLELSAEAGLALALLKISGSNLAVNTEGTRLDVGGRFAVGLRLLTGSRWSPFLALHAVVNPRPYTVVVQPEGDVGGTPMFWVGGTLGIEAGLK